ncbi:VCBS repeat-containing protein [Bacillus clarus]|uniref:Repeat domain in Vibrio, Colwellia, Bradyrhizobium and Shewanella family protein n=1 Tax=Bacillus clarus TaxID=2338372 RepID=A0A090YVG2_9BACI|nr:VCBS repeat-containing protein [Bacillus clarus]KFN01963.1 repeat domain in Vibrio, Colwellia, Bradyrhizobium and Shewanella family protein [Bacillus clarus]RFT67138.1 VCBS repeat-containing protein [Bacillus clarus]
MRKWISIMGIVFILTGCKMSEAPTNLMGAPTNEKWINELKEQIDKDLPVNYRLLTPMSNKDKQMIWSMDFKRDNKKEVIVFYKLPNEDQSIYLAIYEETGNGWKIQSTHTFDGEEVDIVEVGDFTGNGKRELLIGISVSRESLEHVMYAFSEENDDMREIYSRKYTKLFIEDLNKNGLNDISVVTYEKDEQLKVEFIEKFKTMSEVSFDPFINSIQRIQIGRISKMTKAVVIDAGVGAHSGITYVAKFDGDHYEALPIEGEDSQLNDFVVESKDINEDGILEFVRTVRPKGWEEKSHGESPLLERYVQWSEEGIKPIEERYVNIEKGYFVKIPKELIGKITIPTQQEESNVQKFSNASTNELWLEVHIFKRKGWMKIKGYEAAVKTNSHVYAVPKQSNFEKVKAYIKPLADYQ